MSDPVVNPTPSTSSKAEAFVLDVVGYLTKLDVNSLQNDYNQVILGVNDLKQIVSALQELDQLKNSL